VLAYYQRLGPAARGTPCKVLEFNGPLFDQLKALGVVLIGRNYRSPQNLGDKDFANDLIALAREYPQIDYWEGFNEDFQTASELPRFAEYEIGSMQQFERENLGARRLVGGFSCGQPDMAAWVHFRPALQWALDHGHALHFHEYSGPYMQWMTGENQWDYAANQPKKIDDPCTDPEIEGWLDLRHRKVYKLFESWGLGALPLFITEGGIDDVQPRPGPIGKGYKDWRGTEWENIPGIGNYAQQRRWYMWQVSHDKYVKGVVDFGFLTGDPTWGSFDLSTDPSMLEQVIQAESSLPAGHFDEQEAPPPVSDFATDLRAFKKTAQEIEAVPGHALWDRILGDGFTPTGSEKGWRHDGFDYIVQTAAHPKERRPERTYYVKVGDWANVAYIEDKVVVPFLWPCGEPEAERHGTAPPAGWGITVRYNQEYMLSPAGRPAVLNVHPGWDINLPGQADMGVNVYAVGPGVVVYSSKANGSWGNIVMIRHDGVPGYGVLWSQYAHLRDRGVAVGALVQRGQVIGHLGDADGQFGAHLHFELRRHELPADAWPASGGASLALQHQRVLTDYVDPSGILGAV
jgi:hypothetical protein